MFVCWTVSVADKTKTVNNVFVASVSGQRGLMTCWRCWGDTRCS